MDENKEALVKEGMGTQGISALDALEGLAGLVIFWTLSGK